MTTPEGRIKQKISHVLAKHNAWYFMPVPTGFQSKTIDFIVCCKGRFIGIEAKRPGKDATTRQTYILNLIKEAGGLTFVIDSDEGVEELNKTLGGLP
jgi:hypothetical protein